MTRAALILLDDDDPAVSVLGVPWPEFRIRSAIGAGALHIVVVAGRVTPALVAAIDSARSAGVSASLVRTAVEAADLFHPTEAVLLLSGLAIVDEGLVTRLMSADRPMLLCVGPQGDPVWELIDARARWTGLARLDGAQVRTTAAIVGEWDLASTLLRQVVAARAKRLMLDDMTGLYRADRAAEAVLAARRAVKTATRADGGWATRHILNPAALGVGILSTVHLATVARFSPFAAFPPLAAGVVFAWWKWPVLAAALLLLGFFLNVFGALAERATGHAVKLGRWRAGIVNFAASAALAGLVMPPGEDRGPLLLAIMLVVVAALDRQLHRAADAPSWLADVPGYIVIIGVAALFGQVGAWIGLLIALAHAIVSLAWLQNRLSRALTHVR